MIDHSVEVPLGQFLCKAISGAVLTKILTDLGDAQNLIIEPNTVTGNLNVYRRIDTETMRALGWIDVSLEYFEANTSAEDFKIPTGWKTR